MLISIIVPVYNVEKFLPKCIDSILSQTYKNLEIILVNDGSTDKSPEICDDYAGKDSRIRVFHQDNHGVSYARNYGLLQSRGEYVGFIDADDYVHPQMYQILLKYLQDTEADVATCSFCFDHDGIIQSVCNKKSINNHILDVEKFLTYVYERDTYKGVSNYLWTKLYKSSILKSSEDELVIRFDENLALGEDNIFNAEVYCRIKRIVYIDQPLYYYVQHKNSVMHNKEIQMDTLPILQGYERVIDIYESNRINEEVIDLVKRFYVYWCGKYLELSIVNNDVETGIKLQENIKKNFIAYVKMNVNHLDRIKWLIDLMQYNFQKGGFDENHTNVSSAVSQTSRK